MHHEPRLYFDYPGHRRSASTDQHSQRDLQRDQRDRPIGTATTIRRKPSKTSAGHRAGERQWPPNARGHLSGCTTRATPTGCPRKTKTRQTILIDQYKTNIIGAANSQPADSKPEAMTPQPFSLFASSHPFIIINHCPRPEGR